MQGSAGISHIYKIREQMKKKMEENKTESSTISSFLRAILETMSAIIRNVASKIIEISE
ncbi:MAG: hypothetical protein K5766_03120 [Alphaproteobacteria bacterium]|nr:hypothetical protein [Alphaproteobacteria bacterium]